MSDKSKLHYYFVAKSTFSNEACNTHSITTMDQDVVDTNEITVLNEIDANALTSSSLSIITCSESQSQDSGNSDVENRLTTATTTTTTENNREPFSDCSQLNPFKRDPGRGAAAAREFLLLGPYQPITMFPTVNHRHFCPNWYKVYSWVEFSEMTKKAYCYVCRLAYLHGHCDDAFTKNGFQNWSMAIRKFDKHQASSAHKDAYNSYVNAVKNHKENMDVVKLMDIEHKKKTSENRNYLKEIIRTIVFLAKQGLAFRGHRENNDFLNKGNLLKNRYYSMTTIKEKIGLSLCLPFYIHHTLSILGNLLELLEFRSVENELIKKKLNSLKYTHHSIQNEILSIIQEHILSQIVLEIKTAKYYSIMIDETSDISRHEQVSLVIRYTDDQFNIYERFIGFERASDTSGQGLFHLLLNWLKNLGLNTECIVGQCYDGASAMRGKFKGVSTRFTQIVPTALYVHCNGHVLNLCLVDVSEAVVDVRNCFGVVKSLYNFIEASPKRHQVFEDLQKEFGVVPVSLKELCDTRWTCRYESLKAISSRFPEILSTLELIESGDSFILLNILRTFDFVFHVYMMSEIYLITYKLSKFLQHSNITLTDALGQVKVTIGALQSLRNDSDFKRIWNESMKICTTNNIDEPKERRKRKVPLRFGGGDINPTNLTIEDRYLDNSFYAVLDTIITSIKERFDENYLAMIVLCEKLFLTKIFLVEDELRSIAQFYNVGYDDLRAEQRLYKVVFDGTKEFNLSTSTKFFVEQNFHLSLITMNKLLRILWTIPVNVCGCERSFSSLRRIKTYLRNTTGQERLTCLALINIEKDFQIDIDAVVADFVSKKDERKRIF